MDIWQFSNIEQTHLLNLGFTVHLWFCIFGFASPIWRLRPMQCHRHRIARSSRVYAFYLNQINYGGRRSRDRTLLFVEIIRFLRGKSWPLQKAWDSPQFQPLPEKWMCFDRACWHRTCCEYFSLFVGPTPFILTARFKKGQYGSWISN